MDQSTTMGAAHTSMAGSDPTTRLDFWSQTAPRDWVAYGMCFPHHGGREERGKAIQALFAALAKLARDRPKYAGRLRLSRHPDTPGVLNWTPSNGIDAKFSDVSGEIDETYDQLRGKGFPASFFHNPEVFALGINPNPADPTQSDKTPPAGANGAAAAAAAAVSTLETRNEVPVVAIRGFFIKGGLILQICLHHAFGDGYCMRDFLDDFAAETRGEVLKRNGDRRKLHLPLDFLRDRCALLGIPGGLSREGKAAWLASRCPEYTFDPKWFTGPTQPYRAPPASQERTGCVIASIGKAKLGTLRRVLRNRHGHEPSEYVALSALLWAYVTLHRSEVEGTGRGEMVTLSNPVNWKRNLANGALIGMMEDYFGNATAKCLTRVERTLLVGAARQSSAARNVDDVGLEKDARLDDLRGIAAAIRKNIDAVDDAFVALRTGLYRALPDPRNLGLVDDPYSAAYMQFNTWRPFGADARFKIPGVPEDPRGPGGACPESIRKVMMGKQFDFRNVLIMPAGRFSDDTEILVSLPARSLSALLKDKGFTRWFSIR